MYLHTKRITIGEFGKMREKIYLLLFVFIIIVIGNTVIVAQKNMTPPVQKPEIMCKVIQNTWKPM